MRILSARIFLSFLAGKFEKFERRLPWNQLTQKFEYKFSKTSFNKYF